MATRYANHPKHIAPAQLVGTLAVQIPVFMIVRIYSLSALGSFSLAYRMVSLPSILIANAIGDVYRQQISAAYSEGRGFKNILVSTLIKTVLLAIPPCVAIYIMAPNLFEWAFGSNWRVAGEYAQILVVAAFFQFIFTPIDKGAVVVGATRYILAWQAVRLIFIFFLFYAAKFLNMDIHSALWLFVLVNSVLYIIDGFIEFRLAGKW
jgi:O-antigen/teichoic acid export membrane protein